MAKGDDIEKRLISFAVRIIHLCSALPPTVPGKHIARQLVRSGTSPAPNYGEARAAESRRDFIHKLRICLKELNESRIWLLMVVQTEMLTAERMGQLVEECEALCRIINASIHTARKGRSNG